MRFGVFAAAAVCATASKINPWNEETAFTQVAAEDVNYSEFFNDVADFFAQISDDDKVNLGNLWVQTNSQMSDLIGQMHPDDKEKFYNYYAQTRE